MTRIGISFGGSVALGVALAAAFPGVGSVAGAAAGFAGVLVAMGNARAWTCVPAGLGFARAVFAGDAWERSRVRAPTRVEGRIEVVSRRGDAVVVRAGTLRLRVDDSGRSLPDPGSEAHALLRAEPFRSSGHPAAFDAAAWARGNGWHGSAALLGQAHDVRRAAGIRPLVDRAAHAFRERAQRRLGAGWSEEGDLLAALLLGDRSGLERESVDRFRLAGLAHVLALSGLHVGVLAAGAAALLRFARVRGGAFAATLVIFLGAFVLLAGARPPIVRAALGGALATTGLSLGRRPDALHGLGLAGGGILLAQPAFLFDLGFQLSFAATALLALAATRRPAPRRSFSRAGRAVRLGLGAIAISACLTFGTAPLVAGAFGRVSALSPITNLLAGPLATAALGWGGLAALAPGPDGLAAPLAGAARLAAHALLRLTEAAAGWPGAELRLPAIGPAGAGACLAVAAFLVSGRRPGPFARRALVGALGVAAFTARPAERLAFLDVGQGDGVLIESAGRGVLVDAGIAPSAGEPLAFRAAGRRGLTPLVEGIVTHGHADHCGGFPAGVSAGLVRRLRLPPRAGPEPGALEELRALAAGLHVPVGSAPDPHRPARLLRGRIRVFAPRRHRDLVPELAENDHSIVSRWLAGHVSALLTGDLESAGEHELLRSAATRLPATVFKAGHHGARESNAADLLDAVAPRLAVFSCGPNNPHGHPHAEAVARIDERGIASLRTDRDGSVAIRATARGLRVRWFRGFPAGEREP